MSNSIGVPLLARDDYKQNGFMTFRYVQSILFGSLPIGFSDFNNIEKFLPNQLIAKSNDISSLQNIINYLRNKNIYMQLTNYLIHDKIKNIFNIKTFIQEMLS